MQRPASLDGCTFSFQSYWNEYPGLRRFQFNVLTFLGLIETHGLNALYVQFCALSEDVCCRW